VVYKLDHIFYLGQGTLHN